MDDRGGRLVKALLKVLHKLHEPTPIDLRISVVSPYDGERLTFCKVDGVGRGRSGHRHTLRETRRGRTGTEYIAPERLFWYQISEEKAVKFRHLFQVQSNLFQNSGCTRAFH